MLAAISCLPEAPNADRASEDPKAAEARSESESNLDSDEGSKMGHPFRPDLSVEPPSGDLAMAESGVSSEDADDGGGEENPTYLRDGCLQDFMMFEGACTSKDKVDLILEQREKTALEWLQTARKPKQSAEAAGYLIEQNIAQMDKAEDDLEEIIEQLKRENAASKQKMMAEGL